MALIVDCQSVGGVAADQKKAEIQMPWTVLRMWCRHIRETHELKKPMSQPAREPRTAHQRMLSVGMNMR